MWEREAWKEILNNIPSFKSICNLKPVLETMGASSRERKATSAMFWFMAIVLTISDSKKTTTI